MSSTQHTRHLSKFIPFWKGCWEFQGQAIVISKILCHFKGNWFQHNMRDIWVSSAGIERGPGVMRVPGDYCNFCLWQVNGNWFCVNFWSVLVERANVWLREHPGVRVVCCESLESVANRSTIPDTTISRYIQSGTHDTVYHRSLRYVTISCLPFFRSLSFLRLQRQIWSNQTISVAKCEDLIFLWFLRVWISASTEAQGITPVSEQ